jgi:HEPN domain-containing protein
MSITCEWLDKAWKDLKAAELLYANNLYEESAFHSQQAAEKALKALLTAYRIEPPRTHAIETLLTLLSQVTDTGELEEMDVEGLTYYAVEIRYPGPPIEREEAENAIETARKTLEWVEERLGEKGVECR